jgi:hypothetical protein
MKKLILAFSTMGLIALFLASGGCYYDKEELLYVTQACDTSAVTLSGTLQPILNTSCNSSGCHNSASASANVILDTYAGVKAVADNGKLMASINHTGPSPMPKGAPQLSDCVRSQFQAWIHAGAKQN